MDPLETIAFARALIDIDSTTGREREAGDWLAGVLRQRGYTVEEQPLARGCANILATLDEPEVVLSTHFDCVPPFFPSEMRDGALFGRGACDAKGILAAQFAAAERLRASGERRVGLLFVVGEERGSDGAALANQQPRGSRYLINGEPTDSLLGVATRGVLRVKLRATGRACHSAAPENGISAIDLLIDALIRLRTLPLPADPVLGSTYYTIGLIDGGVAPNVVSPHASAELMFRIVGDGAPIYEALRVVEGLVALEHILEIPAVHLHRVSGFETAVFPYTTDVPVLTRWGRPLLIGPGSIHTAHTDHEHVSIDELRQAVDLYEALAMRLLTTGE